MYVCVLIVCVCVCSCVVCKRYLNSPFVGIDGAAFPQDVFCVQLCMYVCMYVCVCVNMYVCEAGVQKYEAPVWVLTGLPRLVYAHVWCVHIA